jgi:hypothetical protein
LAESSLGSESELRCLNDEIARAADGRQVRDQGLRLIVHAEDLVDVAGPALERVSQGSQTKADVGEGQISVLIDSCEHDGGLLELEIERRPGARRPRELLAGAARTWLAPPSAAGQD